MRFILRVSILIAAAVVLAVGAGLLASELGGEVVRLRSFDADGRGHDTRLWIVNDGGRSYLRGRPGSGWFDRVAASPQVELERSGQTGRFRAVPVEPMRDRVNRLMAEKYGWAEQLIALQREMDQTMPLRLDPAGH
ncbi:MAG: hypothetical protein VCB42_11685 [Myxococcota bacterium]